MTYAPNAPRPGQPAYIVTGPRGAHLARYPFGPGQVAAEPDAKAAAHAWARDNAPSATVERYSGATAHSFAWHVEGESGNLNHPATVHATEAGAIARAVDLLNVLLVESDMQATATADNWRAVADHLERVTDGAAWLTVNRIPLEH